MNENKNKNENENENKNENESENENEIHNQQYCEIEEINDNFKNFDETNHLKIK